MRKALIAIAICTASLNLRAAAQNVFPATGSVGIGTTTPDKALYVNGGIHLNMPGGINWANNQSLLLTNSVDTAAGDTGAQIWHGDGGAGGSHLLIFSSYPQTSSALTGGYMVLNTVSGNVGIGTTTPGTKLQVVGNAQVIGPAYVGENTNGTAVIDAYNGSAYFGDNSAAKGIAVGATGNVTLTAAGASLIFPDNTSQTTAWTGVLCGGDYAESVDVAGGKARYEPGDVMVVDPENAGGFLKSAEPYSTLVAGIYSTKPGVVGRRFTDPDRAKDSVPMAMVGIVPTKVSAENGPVKPGDLLVTSSTAGYAMKGTDRERLTGAILGKALGSVASGAGVIEVLVSLQ